LANLTVSMDGWMNGLHQYVQEIIESDKKPDVVPMFRTLDWTFIISTSASRSTSTLTQTSKLSTLIDGNIQKPTPKIGETLTLSAGRPVYEYVRDEYFTIYVIEK